MTAFIIKSLKDLKIFRYFIACLVLKIFTEFKKYILFFARVS